MATEATSGKTGESPGWRYYLQEKILVIFFLGFSAGLPFPLVYATLTAWLNEAGLQKSTITTFAWVGFAYAFKFLWSPLVDRLTLPLLTAAAGPPPRLAAPGADRDRCRAVHSRRGRSGYGHRCLCGYRGWRCHFFGDAGYGN